MKILQRSSLEANLFIITEEVCAPAFQKLHKKWRSDYIKKAAVLVLTTSDLLASIVCAQQQGNIMPCYEWPDNNELSPRG